jgi:hypothetical protein
MQSIFICSELLPRESGNGHGDEELGAVLRPGLVRHRPNRDRREQEEKTSPTPFILVSSAQQRGRWVNFLQVVHTTE